MRVTIDGALSGVRVGLGDLASPGIVIFERADGSGWLPLDCTLGKWLTKRSRSMG